MKTKHIIKIIRINVLSILIVLFTITFFGESYAACITTCMTESQVIDTLKAEGYTYVDSETTAINYLNECIRSFSGQIKLCYPSNGNMGERLLSYMRDESGGNPNFYLISCFNCRTYTYTGNVNAIEFDIGWINSYENSTFISSTTQAKTYIDSIKSSFSGNNNTLYFFNDGSVDIDELLKFISVENAINNYIGQTVCCEYHRICNNYLTVSFAWKTTASEESTLNDRVNALLPSLNTGSTYDKVKNVHDYICANVSYCQDTVRGYADNFSAYDALISGKAVCDGYAQLFQKFMEKMGIESYILNGVLDSEEHAWNVVKIDGNWYHIDTTWDDQVSYISDSYFLIGSNDISYGKNYGITLSSTKYSPSNNTSSNNSSNTPSNTPINTSDNNSSNTVNTAQSNSYSSISKNISEKSSTVTSSDNLDISSNGDTAVEPAKASAVDETQEVAEDSNDSTEQNQSEEINIKSETKEDTLDNTNNLLQAQKGKFSNELVDSVSSKERAIMQGFVANSSKNDSNNLLDKDDENDLSSMLFVIIPLVVFVAILIVGHKKGIFKTRI